MNVGLFTTLMRTEFLNSMAVVAQPAEYDRFTSIIPTETRETDFNWMTPAPGINLFEGHRRLATLDSLPYSILAKEFDSSFEVPLIDIEDDRAGGYMRRMRDLVMKSGEPFRSRWVMSTIRSAVNTVGFDGTNYFATSHGQGGWNATPGQFAGGAANYVNFTSASNGGGDSTQHRLYYMIHWDTNLKPILYLEKEAPRFMTDAGTPQSSFNKVVRYWIDLRSGFGVSYWWNAIRVDILGLPTIPEVQSILDGIRQMARGFYLPAALVTDPPEYIHEQAKFDATDTTILVDPTLEWLLNHVLNEERIGISSNTFTNNIFRGMSHLIVSNILSYSSAIPGS